MCRLQVEPVLQLARGVAIGLLAVSMILAFERGWAAQDDPLAAALQSHYADLPGPLRYFDAEVDLNGDGTPERVAHVIGPMVCGTGGCPTLVFAVGVDGLRLITEFSITRPPVRASARTSQGWRNLIVHVAGGGLPDGYDAELEFDGEGYPANPTAPPAYRSPDLEGATVLIDDFESFTDGKLLVE